MRPDAEETAQLLLRFSENVFKLKARHLDKAFKMNGSSSGELSMRQFQILGLIEYLDINSIKEISLTTQQSSSTCSLVVSKLEEGGYLTKKYAQQQSDKRKVNLYLTDKGRRALQKALSEGTSKLEDFFSSFTIRQKEDFVQGFHQLVSIFPGTFLKQYDSHTRADPPIAEKVLQAIISMAAWLKTYLSDPNNVYGKQQNIAHLGKYQAMEALALESRLTVSQLAAAVDLSESAASISLSKLAKEGYVDRRYPEAGEDGRCIYFSLTSKGKQEVQEIRLRLLTDLTAFCENMTKEKMDALYQSVLKLCSAFEVNEELSSAKHGESP